MILMLKIKMKSLVNADLNAENELDHYIIEPRLEISNNVVCATSKASDQPAHMRGLIRAFACRLNIL